jgi:hypothetical protein
MSYGHELPLPEVALQLGEYAAWQRNSHDKWMRQHGAYWEQRLVGCKRLKFPVHSAPESAGRSGLGLVPLLINKEFAAKLRQWSREQCTTLVMSVFAAFVGFVLRWCNDREALFAYETDGRFRPDVRNTVGYFAFRLYLRVEIYDGDRFADLIRRVTEEYCNAYEHADYAYMEAHPLRPEFTRNACFNWGVRDTEHFSIGSARGDIVADELPADFSVLEGYEMDSEPMFTAYETGGEIAGSLQFPVERFSFEEMEHFTRSFLSFIQFLMTHPDAYVNDIPLERQV